MIDQTDIEQAAPDDNPYSPTHGQLQPAGHDRLTRLHRATWPATVAVAVALAWCQIVDMGWPVGYGRLFKPDLATRLLLNSVPCLLLIAATAIFLERQARSGRSGLRAWAMQFAAACLVMALLLYAHWRGWRWEHWSVEGTWYAIEPLRFIELPLTVAGLVFFALGCTLHTAGWLCAALIRRHLKPVDPSSVSSLSP